MWHELALRLGGTVSELKHRMSSAEFSRWIKYRNRHGAMDDRRTVDRPAALISSVIARIHGGKAEVEDFMPKQEEQEPVISDPRQLAAIFGKLK